MSTATAARKNGTVVKDTVAPTVEIATISPADAKQILEYNVNNRNLRPGRVEQFVGAMRRGEWVFNGDAIRIAKSGRLLDGQHRLVAVAQSGVPQRFVKITGLDDVTQETMDAGAKRTLADILKLRGEKDVNRLASIIRNVFLYETTESFRPPHIVPTAQELLACLGRHPSVRESIPATRPVLNNTQFAGAPAGACHYLFSLVDAVDTEIFFTRFALGTDLTPKDPIYALRRLLLAPRPGRATIASYMQAALAIKAFNYWRRGEPVSHLVWRPGGGTAEKFPTIDGLELSA
jgi:hypothetical protein